MLRLSQKAVGCTKPPFQTCNSQHVEVIFLAIGWGDRNFPPMDASEVTPLSNKPSCDSTTPSIRQDKAVGKGICRVQANL